jgi:hypothetical protein
MFSFQLPDQYKPVVPALTAALTAIWPLYASCTYLIYGGNISAQHLNACMVFTGFTLSLVTTPMLRDRLLCFGDTYISLSLMTWYSAGIGLLLAAASVMRTYKIEGSLLETREERINQGGFVVFGSLILMGPAIISAIRGQTDQPLQRLSIKRRTVTVSCVLVFLIILA